MSHYNAGHLQISSQYYEILEKLYHIALVASLYQEIPLFDTLTKWHCFMQGFLDTFQGNLRHLLRFSRGQVPEAGRKLHLIYHAPMMEWRAWEVDHAQHKLDAVVIHENRSQV